MKKLLALSLSFVMLNAHADILDKLESTPASRLDIGKLSLEFLSYAATKEIQGRDLKGSPFDFVKVTTLDTEQLGFKLTLEGKSRELTESNCQNARKATSYILNKDKIIRDIWSDLSENEYSELSNKFILVTELVDRDNENLKISCQ